MFKSLRNKLKKWTEKISETKEKETEETSEDLENQAEEPEKSDKKDEVKKAVDKVKEIVDKADTEKIKRIGELRGKMKYVTSDTEKQLEEIEAENIEAEKTEEIEEEPKEERGFMKKIVEKVSGKDKETQDTEEKTEEIEEEPKEEKKGFMSGLGRKIATIKISEKELEIYGEDLEMLLLENNVAFEVTEEIIKKLKEKMIGKELLKGEIEFEIRDTLKKVIEEILIEPFNIREKIKIKEQKPFVILLCGVNGTGKTTTIAKITEYLKREDISCVLAAGDTFRAASIEQIKKHAENLKVPVIAQQYGSDPAAVGFDAIEFAKKHKADCVLIDTAGRMHTAKNLMNEIEKVVRVCKPDIKIFVGESTTGNDMIEQAKSFNWHVGIDGIILTKADTDEKGGTALSVGYVTKRPILFLGIGQEYQDIQAFNKRKFVQELGL